MNNLNKKHLIETNTGNFEASINDYINNALTDEQWNYIHFVELDTSCTPFYKAYQAMGEN